MNKKSFVSCGKFRYSYDKNLIEKTGELNMRHCHDVYEILYVIEGHGKFITEGREYPMRSHTLLVIPPLEYHYVDIKPGTTYERCVINFCESELLPECKELVSRFKKNDDEQTNFYIANVNAPPVIALFEQFEYAYNIPESHRGTYIKLLISELVLLLSTLNCDMVNFEDAELGARVIRYLNEHIERDISLDKLAKRFFVSKYYLCRAFKKRNGISVHGYINQKRVMYAKQLIESGETASRAAYRVGFGDYSAFYRAYVKIVGKSPTAN